MARMRPGNPNEERTGHRAIFATTHWSVVLQAGHEAGDATERALETLCRAYWYPIYVYVRRLGHSAHDAQDFTQSFFEYLLEKRLLAKAQPESGRFRSFLLGSLKNSMATERRKQTAQKRGGGNVISIDTSSGEERYSVEPLDESTPQYLYEQAWAAAVLDQSLALLEAEYAGAGKQQLFQILLPALQGDAQLTYAGLGAPLGLSEGAVKVSVHRMRQRYRELLRSAVAHTVADPREIDGELRHLMQVLEGR
jgi:RNA polymerase sigma-70 factor (ECF subfamily)